MPFDATAQCDNPIQPLVTVDHSAGACSIIGGVVWHDPRLAALEGRYLYGDYCTGVVTSIVIDDESVKDADALGINMPQLSSFGVDGLDRVYVMSTAGGVYRLDPAPAATG
jgi:hypothetical protein